MSALSSPQIDIYPLLAQGMRSDLHWYPEDVAVTRLAATMVGMANTTGGTVLIGISPRSGHIQGVVDVQEMIDRVFQAAVMADPPLVLPVPIVYRLAGPTQARIVWVTIPAGLPQVYCLGGSYLGREGSQTNPLTARRLRQLLMERGTIQFESQVPPGAGLGDLDPVQVEAYLQTLGLPGNESPTAILQRRGCLAGEGEDIHPTYAALLLFGKHPQRWLPNASILAGRFPGQVFSDHYVKQDIAGTLPNQIRMAEVFLRDNLRSVVRLVGFTRQDTLEYPIEAVRELVVNAVAHRDYNIQGDNIRLNIFSERLEVSSPGYLPGPVNLNNLIDARFSRNAVVVQVLSDLGFIERLGYGLDRVVSVLREVNLPAPRFEETAGCFKVTLLAPLEGEVDLQRAASKLSAYQGMDLNSRQQIALTYLVAHKRITNSTYQDLCPAVHPETLRRDLVDLVSRGVLIKIGVKRATYYILK